MNQLRDYIDTSISICGYCHIPIEIFEDGITVEDIVSGTSLQYLQATLNYSFRIKSSVPAWRFGDPLPEKEKKHKYEADYIWKSML